MEVFPSHNDLEKKAANSLPRKELANLLGSGGFEPSKAEPTDLQSAPFDRSGNSPKTQTAFQQSGRAASRNRTGDLMITSQVLYQLS